MTKKFGSERRQHPRVDQNLPLSVIANGYDFATNTQNVSCLGAYCHIEKYVPPFTKVMVKLSLPVVEKYGNRTQNVECRGVVVRSEDSSSGGFNVAIFFNHINEEQKKKISRYVSQFLSKETPASARV